MVNKTSQESQIFKSNAIDWRSFGFWNSGIPNSRHFKWFYAWNVFSFLSVFLPFIIAAFQREFQTKIKGLIKLNMFSLQFGLKPVISVITATVQWPVLQTVLTSASYIFNHRQICATTKTGIEKPTVKFLFFQKDFQFSRIWCNSRQNWLILKFVFDFPVLFHSKMFSQSITQWAKCKSGEYKFSNTRWTNSG